MRQNQGRSISADKRRVRAKARPKPERPSHIDSSAELAYFNHLEDKRRQGMIREFYLKPGSLRLGDVYYYPDFLVVHIDGTLDYREVKANHRFAAKGIAKLKMFAAHYADLTFTLVMAKTVKKLTTFEYTEIET